MRVEQQNHRLIIHDGRSECWIDPWGKDSLRVGIGMMVRAEVVLICTQKGIDGGLVDPAVYPFVFIIIIATSILAPLLLKLTYKKEDSGLGNTPIEQQV